jgi:septal ring factor EnvC (AmiA/AmiB activator)
MKKRAKDIENLIAGKKVHVMSSSKSPVTSLAARKQKTSAAEQSELPTDDFNAVLDRVLNKFKKQKTPVAEASTPKVTVSGDVMDAVNQKLTEMMKIINQQQTEIEQLKKNDKKMLDVVVYSQESQEELEAKIKQLQDENQKLLLHEQRNTRRYITMRLKNKKLRANNKSMKNIIDELCSKAPQLKEVEEDKEKEEDLVDFKPSESEKDEEDDEDLEQDAGVAPEKKKKKDGDDKDGSGDDSGDNSSASDDDDYTKKYKCEKRDTGKDAGESSSKAPGGNTDDDDIFWNEKSDLYLMRTKSYIAKC